MTDSVTIDRAFELACDYSRKSRCGHRLEMVCGAVLRDELVLLTSAPEEKMTVWRYKINKEPRYWSIHCLPKEVAVSFYMSLQAKGRL